MLIPLMMSLLVLVLHLACMNRYGFFRDELYFVVCGRKLDWGYVDQPPLIAWIARAAWWMSGDGRSIAIFRLPAYLAGAAVLPVTALVAQRLGGGRFAMALASAAVLGAGLPLAQGHLLTMNVFEILLWSLIALATLVAVNGKRSVWLTVGALIGLALLNKYSAGLLAMGLLVGLASTRARASTSNAWFWTGLGLGLVLALPSLCWQTMHGFPFLELLRNGRLYKNLQVPFVALCDGTMMEQGPLGILLAGAGMVQLLWQPSRPVVEGRLQVPEGRFLGVALLMVLAIFALLGAKPYYLGPAFPPLFAAGAVLAERSLPAWALLRAGLVALPFPILFMMAPLALPLFSSSQDALAWMERIGVRPVRLERKLSQEMPQHFADQAGWPEQVSAVADIVHGIPTADRAGAVIFTTNYGRAAALELLGERLELPPVICSHNQYLVWGVSGNPQVVIALGGSMEDYVSRFDDVLLIGRTPPNPLGMVEESEVPIYFLRGPHRPVSEMLRDFKHYD